MTYWGVSFIEFFAVFASRLIKGFPGGLCADEIQLITLLAIACSAALIGAFLVVRKVTMVAAALTHTILPGLVVTYFLLGGGLLSMTTLLTAAVVTSVFTVFLTNFCLKTLKLQEDASIGLVFTVLFALGVLLVSCYMRNTHFGVEMILGNVDGLTLDDMRLSAGLLALNGVGVLLLYRLYFMTSFDPLFSASVGISDRLVTHVLMIQTALTVVGGFRAVGVILILALLTGPVLIARLFVCRMIPLIMTAIGVGALCSALGVATSRHFLSLYNIPLSTAGWVVTYLFFMYTVLSYGKKTYCAFRKYRINWAADAQCGPAPQR